MPPLGHNTQAEVPEQGAMRMCGVDGFEPYRAAATLLATAMSPPPSMEEVAALRTPDLDRYLPPRRHPSAWQSRPRIVLDFAHCPIVDLGLPEPDRCLPACLTSLWLANCIWRARWVTHACVAAQQSHIARSACLMMAIPPACSPWHGWHSYLDSRSSNCSAG
jgi:hypothetical protein